MQENSILGSAIRYREKNLIPIPVRPAKGGYKGKEPLLKKWQKLNLGNYSIEDVKEKFNNHTGNIGLVMGVENIVCIDFDNVDIYDEFYKQNKQLIDNTPVQKTGKGYHVFLKVLDGGFTGPALYNNVHFGEIRSNGGQVVVWPSIHECGHQYTWMQSIFDFKLQEIDSLNAVGIYKTTAALTVQVPKKDVSIHRITTTEEAENYLQYACKQITGAPHGNRNNTLSYHAGKALLLSNNGLLDKDYIMGALTKAAHEGNHPPGDIYSTIESALKYSESKNKNKSVITEDQLDEYNLTEMGNAYRVLYKYADILYYIKELGNFVLWENDKWEVQKTEENMHTIYKEMLNGLNQEADNMEGDKQAEQVRKWALKSESYAIKQNTFNYIKDKCSKLIEQFDNNDYQVNCKNGILDLRTMQLQPATSDIFMLKQVNAHYDPQATAPRWQQFIKEITCNNDDLAHYIQKILGCCISGDTSAKCMFFFFGSKGNNGKSTLINMVEYILSGYAKRIDSNSLMSKKPNGINNDIAALKGARLVIGSEIGSGKYFNDGLIRDLCGNGDPISARFLRQEYFTFVPVFKLILYGNQKPCITATDKAIRKKIKIVPFEFETNNPDYTLMDTFKTKEIDGIFNWLVEGFKLYKQEGLVGEPLSVAEETSEYFNENDSLSQFIDEKCVCGPQQTVAKGELYTAYCEWMQQNNEPAYSKKRFGMLLKGKGFSNKIIDNGRTRVWSGVALQDNAISVPCFNDTTPMTHDRF